MSKSVTEDYEDTVGTKPREMAPSVMQADEPRVARLAGTIGLFLVVLSGAAIFFQSSGVANYIGPFWRTVMMATGLALLLYHAARDGDMQVRRVYGLLGYVLLVAAAAISILPINAPWFSRFLPFGFLFLMLALLFLMAFMRSEDNPVWRLATLRVLLVVGAGLALLGLVRGFTTESFLLPYGLILASVGLAYLWAFVGIEGTSTTLGYRVGFALGVAGAITILFAVGRSVLVPLFFQWGWIAARPEPFFVPSGLLLTIVGAIFLGLSVGMCSDWRLAVLTRRELSSYFYSPMAYLVLFGFGLVGWWMFLQFVGQLSDAGRFGGAAMQEPIVANYILNWFPIIFLVILGIPVLTMRSFSEEQRTGTMEVLLTVPVSEVTVVLSKFIAVWIFYLLTWLPWALFLVSLRVETEQAFEYRPLLSFFIALACTGAGFLSMGLFFSSLTRNQMVAAVMTAVGMLFFTSILFVKREIQQRDPQSIWVSVFSQASYLDLWIMSIGEGSVAPKLLLFHLTAAVFWLFLTVKVLESRKWR
jgi:ABC-2 type transport system permease protein